MTVRSPQEHGRSPRVDADDVAALAARLRLSTTRLARRLRSEADIGLSPSQLSALAAVHVHGPVTLGDLADHERVSRPTVTKVVDRLEQSGFLRRIADDDDRRVCRVAVTDAGRDLVAQSRERKTAWLAARLGGVDRRDRERLAAALDVLDELAAGEPR